jgi:DNA-binding SARP family transcriptional activator
MRQAPRVQARYRLLRRLRQPTRTLLDLLSGEGPAPTPLRVSPYEHGCLTIDGREIDLILALPERSREVFFYVALNGGQKRTEEVTDAVWPDEGSTALRSLWDAGRDLRRLLGKDIWQVRSGMCTLTVPVLSTESEVAACALACQRAGSPREVVEQAGRALDLIGDGRYLDWCNNPWVEGARMRTAREGISLALALAEAHGTLGEPELALAAARLATGFDPYDERPQHAIVRLLRGQGRDEEALLTYKAFARFLSSELGISPTTDLARSAGVRTG